MKILVVEPHPDDAFLSLGWHLEKLWAEHERVILTVYANEKRSKEARAYAEAIGAVSVCMGYKESNMNSGGAIRRDPTILREILAIGADRIIAPLGLQHPDHLRVAASRPANCLRYLDTPYLSKQKLASILRIKTEGYTINSICFPPRSKWRRSDIYKSQSKFFYFNLEKMYNLPEIVLE